MTRSKVQYLLVVQFTHEKYIGQAKTADIISSKKTYSMLLPSQTISEYLHGL